MTDLPAARRLVQVRLPADLVKQIDHVAVEWGDTGGMTMERLLLEAMAQIAETRERDHLPVTAKEPAP